MVVGRLHFVASRRHKIGHHKQLIVGMDIFLSFNGDSLSMGPYSRECGLSGYSSDLASFLAQGMNKLLLIAALVAAAYFALAPGPDTPESRQAAGMPAVSSTARDGNDAAIENAFSNRLGSQLVEGRGTVVKMLADDNDGSRHQRFIIRLDSGRTLLISHNIDLAPRIDGLRTGDTVAFYGEYEWNSKGGVIHWTHHDPQGRHPAGWIRHDGRTYQ